MHISLKEVPFTEEKTATYALPQEQAWIAQVYMVLPLQKACISMKLAQYANLAAGTP